jgi:uncharacterized protein (UPF0335 family)
LDGHAHDSLERMGATMGEASSKNNIVAPAGDILKSIVERVERLREEKKAIDDDVRDVYAEAKGNGFDVKAIKTIISLRAKDPSEVAEQETILDTYMRALESAGMKVSA